jgi:hypothetical protein
MAYVRRHVVTIVTDGSGDGTGYTDALNGFVHAIRYAKTDYADGVDFTITAETSGIAVLTTSASNAAATFHPRAATVDTANAASLYAAAGTTVNALIPVADERLKIVVAQGGATKTGTFHVYVGG